MKLFIVCWALFASFQFIAAKEVDTVMKNELDELRKLTSKMTFIVDEIIGSVPPRSKAGVSPTSTEITSPSLNVDWDTVTLTWTAPDRAIGYVVELITENGVMPPIRLNRFATSFTTTETKPDNLYRIRVTPIMFRGEGTVFTTDFFIPECPRGLACPRIYRPLCGTDGKTYSNKCQLEVVQCLLGDRESNTLEIDYPGECDPCAFIACDPPQCPEGFVLGDAPLRGECCAGCLDECTTIECPPTVCSDGYVTRNFEGECCPRCAPDAFKDCADAQAQGMTVSGVYTILPEDINTPFDVYCDLNTDGGDWTVILRRVNSTVDFYRPFADYETGFGDITGAFWIGLENLYRLGQQGNTELLVTMIDRMGTEGNGTYSSFQISSRENDYSLTTVAGFSGEIGNALFFNRGAAFSAMDLDLDNSDRNCSVSLGGAWWYQGDPCSRSNPTGEYMVFPNFGFEKGVFWAPFRGKQHSLPFLEMKIRTAAGGDISRREGAL